jgi:hypothetical protein
MIGQYLKIFHSSILNLSNLLAANSTYFITLKFSEKSVTKPLFIDR